MLFISPVWNCCQFCGFNFSASFVNFLQISSMSYLQCGTSVWILSFLERYLRRILCRNYRNIGLASLLRAITQSSWYLPNSGLGRTQDQDPRAKSRFWRVFLKEYRFENKTTLPADLKESHVTPINIKLNISFDSGQLRAIATEKTISLSFL